jgi:hypothetical protein
MAESLIGTKDAEVEDDERSFGEAEAGDIYALPGSQKLQQVSFPFAFLQFTSVGSFDG